VLVVLTSEVVASLGREFGPVLFQTQIRDNAAITESSGHSKSVFDYAPKSNGAEDYLALTDEFLKQEAQRS
jgi:chromosome partitioning protein